MTKGELKKISAALKEAARTIDEVLNKKEAPKKKAPKKATPKKPSSKQERIAHYNKYLDKYN